MFRIVNRFTLFNLRYNCLSQRRNIFSNEYIDISNEVKQGLSLRKPVVALESTIVTHGMPYPQNLNCALEVENIIREQGAIPASIAIINGRIKVGLNEDELSHLANTSLQKSIKTSRRDLSYVISNRLNGGTTVSGTIVIAVQVGIPIFVTGGIGGVHRNGENTLDISADLTELGRNNIAVVSSGVKSILDIPRTLEYLETQGVLVTTFGNGNEFPAFYTRKSNCYSPFSVSTPLSAAELITSSQKLNLQSGILIAVPVPSEYEINPDLVEKAINQALDEAKENGITGKEVTPFLLSKIADITSGNSLETNIALIKHNAEIGAKIACELSGLNKPTSTSNYSKKSNSDCNEPVIIGATVVDHCAKIQDPELKLDGSTNNTSFTLSLGGVGRNICDALTKLGGSPKFISAIGNDLNAEFVRTQMTTDNMKNISCLPNYNTAQYTAVIDSKGECRLGMGDMKINEYITPEMIKAHECIIKNCPLLILDGNLSIASLSCALELAQKYNVPVFFEPTDVRKAMKPFSTIFWKAINYISPNLLELRAIADSLFIRQTDESNQSCVDEALFLAKSLSKYIKNIIVTLGKDGLLIITEDKLKLCECHYYPTEVISHIVNVSGAGDSFISGYIRAMLSGKSESICVSVGFAAAKLSLQSNCAVPKILFDLEHISWTNEAKYINVY